MFKLSIYKVFLLLIFVMSIFFTTGTNSVFAFDQTKEHRSEIYYNEACAMCSLYLKTDLIKDLKQLGVGKIIQKDYINEKQYRSDLLELNTRLGIPFDLQSHIMTFIDDGDIVLAGHIPEHLISDLKNYADQLPQHLLIYQDKMGGHGDSIDFYKVWVPGTEVKQFDISDGLQNYLTWYQNNHRVGDEGQKKQKSIFGLIMVTGFLDGINPCAIAVLIFFLAFLFMLRSSVGRIVAYGILYIVIIYLTYLGIGLGLFKAILLTGEPHFMAKLGSWLLVLLGFVNILGYLFPKMPIKMQIPAFTQDTLRRYLTKATLPAVIIGAFLVGLCTFPCSGGIYVAIISLLAARDTFLSGLGYLLFYNVMFVLPLVILLLLVGNKMVLGKVAQLQKDSYSSMKLITGIVMILLAFIMMLWFI